MGRDVRVGEGRGVLVGEGRVAIVTAQRRVAKAITAPSRPVVRS